jgi:hypothetical protein
MKHERPLVTVLDDTIHDALILNMRDLAAILNIQTGKARELCSTGKIKAAIRTGKQLRISAGAVRAYLKSETLPKGDEDYPDLNALRAESRRRDRADHRKAPKLH